MGPGETNDTLHYLDELAQTMGGGIAPAPETAEVVPPVQPEVLPAELSRADAPDSVTPYHGLADELLREANRRVPDAVRDELARHIGSSIVKALSNPEAANDLVRVTDGVLHSVSSGLRSNLLELLQAKAEATPAHEGENPIPTSALGRWRQGRRDTAVAERQNRAAYKERQDELRRLRVQTQQEGHIQTSSLQPGDQITLSMKTPPGKGADAKSTLKLVVDGYEESADGKSGGIRCSVVKEARRKNYGVFLHDALTAGATVVIPGTKPTGTESTEHSGGMGKNQELVLSWEGQQMPLHVAARLHMYSGEMREIIVPLELQQLTANGVEMFSKPKVY